MKAIVRDQYGSPDLLWLEDIRIPTPADNEALVKAHPEIVARVTEP